MKTNTLTITYPEELLFSLKETPEQFGFKMLRRFFE